MKVSELITKLQRLNYEHFCAMKEVTPMGGVPGEPEIYLDVFCKDQDGNIVYKGLGTDVNVHLDLQFGIVVEHNDTLKFL